MPALQFTDLPDGMISCKGDIGDLQSLAMRGVPIDRLAEVRGNLFVGRRDHLPSLRTVEGTLTVNGKGGKAGGIARPVLELPALESVEGTMYINLLDTPVETIRLPRLTRVGLSLCINARRAALPNLELVKSLLHVHHEPGGRPHDYPKLIALGGHRIHGDRRRRHDHQGAQPSLRDDSS